LKLYNEIDILHTNYNNICNLIAKRRNQKLIGYSLEIKYNLLIIVLSNSLVKYCLIDNRVIEFKLMYNKETKKKLCKLKEFTNNTN